MLEHVQRLDNADPISQCRATPKAQGLRIRHVECTDHKDSILECNVDSFRADSLLKILRAESQVKIMMRAVSLNFPPILACVSLSFPLVSLSFHLFIMSSPKRPNCWLPQELPCKLKTFDLHLPMC